MAKSQLVLVRDDITKLDVDCIVNAANKTLLGGKGVDGAIHRAAGNQLLKECKTLKGCKTGETKITSGYHLKARYVIHTVGPDVSFTKRTEKTDSQLYDCYRNSLELMRSQGLTSIAFPCISTGDFCYPNEVAAEITLRAIGDWLHGKNPTYKIVLCTFLPVDFKIYKTLMQK